MLIRSPRAARPGQDRTCEQHALSYDTCRLQPGPGYFAEGPSAVRKAEQGGASSNPAATTIPRLLDLSSLLCVGPLAARLVLDTNKIKQRSRYSSISPSFSSA